MKSSVKILYISLSSVDANTSAALRNKALIKGLVSNGAVVDFLTISSQTSNSYYDKTVDKIDGVNIIRLNQSDAYLSMVKQDASLKGRLRKLILPFARKIYHSVNIFDNTMLIARKVSKDILPLDCYDLIISSSDPKSSHIAAKRIIESGLKYGKWIQYWGDPLAIDITKKTLYPEWYVKKVEEKIITLADKIVYVSPFTLKEQKKLFSKISGKMEFQPIPYLEPKIFDVKKERVDRLTLAYFGDYHSKIRNIEAIYNYGKKSGNNVLIAGNSDFILQSTRNIDVYPRISQREVSNFESKSDILVCILNKTGTQIPGKIYHYAATNKPVLVLLDGENKQEIADYLKSFDRYVLCENNEDEIEKAVHEITMNQNKWEPSPFFSPKSIGGRFIKMIEELD